MGFLDWLLRMQQPKPRPKPSFSRDDLLQEFDPYRRSTWVPIVQDGDADPKASKFSGVAFIPPGEAWPSCPNCKQPMQLFVQINPADVPEAVRERFADRALQFFYCTNYEAECETRCDGWEPFSRCSLPRLVSLEGEPSLSESPVAEAFPPKRIDGWEESPDFPGWEEMPDDDTFDAGKFEALIDLGFPIAGEKLGGWPMWVQSMEYPSCPECGQEMTLLFQVDSEKNLPYMFGDVGCGHITQCPNHPEILAFGWACY